MHHRISYPKAISTHKIKQKKVRRSAYSTNQQKERILPFQFFSWHDIYLKKNVNIKRDLPHQETNHCTASSSPTTTISYQLKMLRKKLKHQILKMGFNTLSTCFLSCFKC